MHASRAPSRPLQGPRAAHPRQTKRNTFPKDAESKFRVGCEVDPDCRGIGTCADGICDEMCAAALQTFGADADQRIDDVCGPSALMTDDRSMFFFWCLVQLRCQVSELVLDPHPTPRGSLTQTAFISLSQDTPSAPRWAASPVSPESATVFQVSPSLRVRVFTLSRGCPLFRRLTRLFVV